MHQWDTLSHVKWECKYHVVFIPKYRKKVLYNKLRRQVGAILRDLCVQKGIGLLERHAMPDHIHILVSIPPKYSVSYTIGFLKGKSAVRVHREILKERRMTGLHFWATGYCVSTVGLDEQQVRQYVRDQEKRDRLADGQPEFWDLKK
jgi:putative transposase